MDGLHFLQTAGRPVHPDPDPTAPSRCKTSATLFSVDINFPQLFSNSVIYLDLDHARADAHLRHGRFLFRGGQLQRSQFSLYPAAGHHDDPCPGDPDPKLYHFQMAGVGWNQRSALAARFLGRSLRHLSASSVLPDHSARPGGSRPDGWRFAVSDISGRSICRSPSPALAALAIFTFQGAWNDLLHPLVYMPAVPNTTLTVGLAFFQQQITQSGKFTVLMAGALISILPLVVVFFFAQKQFIEGIALSGVKR